MWTFLLHDTGHQEVLKVSERLLLLQGVHGRLLGRPQEGVQVLVHPPSPPAGGRSRGGSW